MQFASQKITIAGDIVEHDVLDQPVKYGPTNRKKYASTSKPVSSPEENEESSANRAKAAVRRLVNANAYKWLKPTGQPYLPIFVTFTFEEDIRDLDIANNIFTIAMKRLNYFVNKGLKTHCLHYVAITEFQDKTREGVIHYHVLFFNLPFIAQVYDEIKRIWQHGNINVKSVRNVRDLGKYMVKYMTKNLKDGRLKGRKKYFASKGLKRWRVIYEKDLVELMVEMIPESCKVNTVSFDNKHCKKITRTTYNVKDDSKALAWYYDLVLNKPECST